MKKNFIKLITNPKEVNEKNAEPKFETFITPGVIPLRKMYEASDLMDQKEIEKMGEKYALDMMMDMLIDIYGNKFTKDDLLDRMHSPDAIEEINDQITWLAQGQMDDERKKQLEKMI